MQSIKIKIFTRSANIELYTYSQKLIECNYPKVRLCNTTADGYFYKMLSDIDCDVAINIDEDAFLTDQDALLDLVKYVVENDIANVGMPDGGMLYVRAFNPIITNPFFNILNLKLIREKFSLEEVMTFDYLKHKQELITRFPKQLLAFNENSFDCSDYEPFYPFFFWLAYNFKILYLRGEEHNDGISTILHNHENKPFLYHSWWSRVYDTDKFHRERIKSLISEVYTIRNKQFTISNSILLWRRGERYWQYFWNFGAGAWINRPIKKSPIHYLRRLKERISTNRRLL